MKTRSVILLMACLLLVVALSGCINSTVPEFYDHFERQMQYETGKYNHFFADYNFTIENAYIYVSGGVEVLDHFESPCFHKNYEGGVINYTNYDPGIGWKFITFDVSVTNNMSNKLLKFMPNRLEDTDKLNYRNEFNSKICDIDLVPARDDNFNILVEPKDDMTFCLIYKIPSSSVPDKFYYSIYAIPSLSVPNRFDYNIYNFNHTWSASGELDLR